MLAAPMPDSAGQRPLPEASEPAPVQEPARRLSALALAAGTGEDIAALASPGAGRLRLKLQGRPLKAFLLLLAVATGLVLARFAGIGGGAPQADAAPAGHTVSESQSAQPQEPQEAQEGPGSASEGSAAAQAQGVAASAGTGAGAAAGSSVVAYISGAVAAPGVYSGPAGMRINDLVTLAGGLGEQADAARINLAAAVADGEHIHVPALGEEMPAPAAPNASGGASADAQGGAQASAGGGLVNVNAASVQELQSLPGIGPALAGAIVTWREENGRFSAIEDLLEVSGIGDAKFAQLRDKVSVG